MEQLSTNMILILSALLSRPMYGLGIIESVKESSQKEISLGSLYNALHSMEKNGFVTSSFGESTLERGGNRRKYYKITASGIRAVNEIQSVFLSQWGLALS